jgi:hypothetical protein
MFPPPLVRKKVKNVRIVRARTKSWLPFLARAFVWRRDSESRSERDKEEEASARVNEVSCRTLKSLATAHREKRLNSRAAADAESKPRPLPSSRSPSASFPPFFLPRKNNRSLLSHQPRRRAGTRTC